MPAARSSHRHSRVIIIAIRRLAGLPKQIRIEMPATQLDLSIDLDEMQVNSLGPQSASLWVKPTYPGYPEVNLAQAAPPMAGPAMPPQATIPPPNYVTAPNYTPPPVYAPQSYTPAPATSYAQPGYR